MSETTFYDDDDGCWQCGGDGGWTSCVEDTCCAIGGEEGCDDPICWRKCDICKGAGFIARAEQDDLSPQTQSQVNNDG